MLEPDITAVSPLGAVKVLPVPDVLVYTVVVVPFVIVIVLALLS